MRGAVTASTCLDCEEGKFSPPGSAQCGTCDPGTFFDVASSAAEPCEPCAAGTFSEHMGSFTCEPCAEGKYSTQQSSTCEQCEAGKYNPTTGRPECLECGRGKFSNKIGQASETTCEACPKGKSSPAEGLPMECTTCSEGSYAPKEGYAMCAVCRPNTVANEEKTTCVVGNGFYEAPGGDVKQAPNGIKDDVGGMTLWTLDLLPNFWRSSNSSTSILHCLGKEHCVGGSDSSNYCAEGYRGALCAVCEKGYAAVGVGESLSCKECSGSSIATAVFGIIFFLFVIASLFLIYFRRERFTEWMTQRDYGTDIIRAIEKLSKVGPMIKTAFAYFQVVGGLGFVFSVKFPPFFSSVASFFGGLFSFDFISFMPGERSQGQSYPFPS